MSISKLKELILWTELLNIYVYLVYSISWDNSYEIECRIEKQNNRPFSKCRKYYAIYVVFTLYLHLRLRILFSSFMYEADARTFTDAGRRLLIKEQKLSSFGELRTTKQTVHLTLKRNIQPKTLDGYNDNRLI